VTRLPTLLHRPAPERGTARPRPLPCVHHARALLATRRSSTSAIETIHKHDLRTPKPSSFGGRSTFIELLAHGAGPHFDGAAAGFPMTIPSKRSRGFTGQGPLVRDLLSRGPAGLPRRDGSLRRLRPNPIGSNTSCRATRADYDRSTVIGIAERAREPSERIRGLAPGDPLARGLPGRAASRTPSRKGDAFRRTRGAFRRKTPLAGSALVHSL